MDAAWVPFGIMFQEFHDFQPKIVIVSDTRKYTRTDTIVMVVWTLSTFLLVAAYIGNLKSHLIIQNYEEIIATLPQLLEE